MMRDELNAAPRPMDEAVEMELDEGTVQTNAQSVLMRIEEHEQCNRQLLQSFILEPDPQQQEQRPPYTRPKLVGKAVEMKKRSRACLPFGVIKHENRNDDVSVADINSIPSCINVPACLSMTNRSNSVDERWEQEHIYLSQEFARKKNEASEVDWRSIYERDGLVPGRCTLDPRPPKHSSLAKFASNRAIQGATRRELARERLGALACVVCVKSAKGRGEEMTGAATESSGKVDDPAMEGHFRGRNNHSVEPSMYSI